MKIYRLIKKWIRRVILNLTSVLNLLAGIGLFLYGMNLMGDGLKNAAGASLEHILEKLKIRYKLGIITNGPKSQQYMRLRNTGIYGYFSYVFISEEVGYNKPDINFFEYVLKKIEEKDKSKILIIGDSLTSDIQGGRNCEIDTCWYNRKLQNDNFFIKPNYEIKNLKELLEIL